MTHAQLVEKAVRWLRSYRCGVILSEQACASGEMPDAIGWKKACHSVMIECKVTRSDFLVDREKPWRQKPERGVGSERFYLTLPGMIKIEELPDGWGLLEYRRGRIEKMRESSKNLRSATGFRYEMNLLLASLRRVEVRIEPQSITDFLKWKNRMAEYNRGTLPEGLSAATEEMNEFLEMNHPEQAFAEYETELKVSPNRFNSLYGAGRAAEAEGKSEKAAAYYRQLTATCANADSSRPELVHAREFLSATAK